MYTYERIHLNLLSAYAMSECYHADVTVVMSI